MHRPILAVALSIVSCCTVPVHAAAGGTGIASDDTIERLLEHLEAAVLDGDAEEYLTGIDTTDPEWATEQTNWAADLAEHTPEMFDLDLLPRAEASADLDPAEHIAALRMTWQLPGGRERRVEFPARFTHDESGGWHYAGEAWSSVSSRDGQTIVLFLTDELQEIAERITEMMPGIREHVDTGFETHLDHPQVVKLYTDMGHLQQSIYLSYTDGLGGWNEPGEAIKIMAGPRMGARQLRILLSHEYGHVATFTYHEDVAENLPWWVAEGVAELAAERYAGAAAREGMEDAVRAWAKAGTLAAWEDMADFRETPSRLHGHVYLQGHHFVGYVSERFGRSARNAWIRRLASGDPLDEASREALGVSFADLDREWRESLRADE